MKLGLLQVAEDTLEAEKPSDDRAMEQQQVDEAEPEPEADTAEDVDMADPIGRHCRGILEQVSLENAAKSA